ncbi:hypothetical protein GCM10009785_12880 [Brooklawnia cerclae]|uniref:Uncharacterized protein n=1 Tax=Brooklawnia cerclae TaxID=349934 RepID=A0ABX0SK72_9ACTN|nr:hypothetical protein [Brooklawnia cerclae]NIH58797.1 hypothetical protein [Brooklawnia cerclae]
MATPAPDAEILAAARDNVVRRWLREYLITFGIVAVVMVALSVAGLGPLGNGHLVPRVGWTITLVAGVALAAVGVQLGTEVVARRLHASRPGQDAGPLMSGLPPRGQTRTTLRPAQVWPVIAPLLDVPESIRPPAGATTLGVRTGPRWQLAPHLCLVDVRPSSDQPGTTVVTVCSQPQRPFDLADYGLSFRRGNEVLGTVARLDAQGG